MCESLLLIEPFVAGLLGVWGPFSIAQPRVVRWRDDLTRPGFF